MGSPASTRDLPTIPFFRPAPGLRRGGPVPGILAPDRAGGIADNRLLPCFECQSVHIISTSGTETPLSYDGELSQMDCSRGVREAGAFVREQG